VLNDGKLQLEVMKQESQNAEAALSHFGWAKGVGLHCTFLVILQLDFNNDTMP